ncbi:hypothetical protein pipiens_007571 [Culex pipiens pipiens]|uniref:Uncharacterized protein n=2 Tax=Culex pipiens TaxID=7175 RepID=A0ABD1DKM0_CULPP
MASLVSQRGQSPVSSTVSSSSMAATPNSGSGSGGGGGGGISGGSQQGAGSAVRKPTTLDTQLAILRREMVCINCNLSISILSKSLDDECQRLRI